MSAEVNVPDEAYQRFLAADRAADHAGHTGTAYTFGIKAAAPRIVAADYEAFAAELRGTLHNLPEYTHGSLAWTVMNAIDAHIEDLRGDR